MELVEKLKERFSKNPAEFSNWNKDNPVWQDFIKKFPAKEISKISLDDYCMGGKVKQGNFCWWLEVGLNKVFGALSVGSARSHIIYKKPKTGILYKHRHLVSLNDNDALQYVLKVTQFIAELPNLENAQKYDEREKIYEALGLEPRVTMGDARRLRLYMAYHPDTTVSINSPVHIHHFLKLFGVKDIAPGAFGKAKQLWELYEQLKESMPGISPDGFAKLLYDPELGLKPIVEVANEDEEDRETIDAGQVSNYPLNVIFFGPPGTGKTYKTVDRALQILDPGFVRVYADNREALVRRFNELRDNKRIGFVTFHQSFSYEEFVEGLKPEKDENDQLVYRIEEGIFKELCVAAASKVTQSSNSDVDLEGKRIWKISLGRANGEDAFIYDECIENNYILIGYGGNADFEDCDNREKIEEIYRKNKIPFDTDYPITAVNTFVNEMNPGDIVVVTEGNLKYRAIGKITGEYRLLKRDDGRSYTQCRDVEWLKVFDPSRPKEELTNKTFSQMTLYELKPRTLTPQKLLNVLGEHQLPSQPFQVGEKIAGYTIETVGAEVVSVIKPSGPSLAFPWEMLNTLTKLVKDGKITLEDIKNKKVYDKVSVNLDKYLVNGYANVLWPLIEKMLSGDGEKGATSTTSNARVLIIDEINRGNVAKIFGELITLIEPDKRSGAGAGLSVELPYSKTPFSVPDNLYIIGTMNTADRSLTSLDAALRRRFDFVEFFPEPHLLAEIQNDDGIEIQKVMETINKRIEILLGKEYLIGHSYFLELENDSSLSKIRALFKSKIIPLLQEYFFDDWGKIHRVLGDHQKPENLQIVRSRYQQDEVAKLLGDDWVGAKENCWEINEKALEEPDTYIAIYKH